MKFSVVIVNYQSWPHTLQCIQSLRKTGYKDFEVVIINNDLETAPTLPENTTLIQNPVNEGFARACNQGISASHGDCVVLINPDTLVEKDFFCILKEFLEGRPQAGIVGPKVVDGYGDLQLSARREISFVSGLLGRTSLLTRLFPKSQAVKRMFPAASELYGPQGVDWVSGACMAIRREVFGEIGGLDGRFFMYFEDADLCRRSREAGWYVFYLPQLEVLHLTGESSRDKLRAIWLLHKSAFLYHRKYGPHGPFSIYSAVTVLGLGTRALAKLGAGWLK